MKKIISLLIFSLLAFFIMFLISKNRPEVKAMSHSNIPTTKNIIIINTESEHFEQKNITIRSAFQETIKTFKTNNHLRVINMLKPKVKDIELFQEEMDFNINDIPFEVPRNDDPNKIKV